MLSNIKKFLQEQNWDKIIFEVSVFIIISCALFLFKFFIFQNALVVGFIITSILFFIESRVSFFVALILLIGVTISVAFKKDALAETFAVYTYYFLCIGVFVEFTQYLILEIKNSKYTHKFLNFISNKLHLRLSNIKTPRIKISYEITWK